MNDMQKCIKIMLQELGENADREGLVETPARVEKALRFLCSGYGQSPEKILSKTFKDSHQEMVILHNIEFYSLCEHHLQVFHGKVHVGYIANGKVVGVSKLARLVDCFARRLQIQERMGNQIVDALEKYLKPRGSACVIQAAHMCIQARGIQKQSSIMTTSSMRGVFLKELNARQEFMNLIKEGK